MVIIVVILNQVQIIMLLIIVILNQVQIIIVVLIILILILILVHLLLKRMVGLLRITRNIIIKMAS